MTDRYMVRPLKAGEYIKVSVPGSKSITNRALLLAAMGDGTCTLNGVLFSGDSRAFLSCLKELGFTLKINEDDKTIIIDGTCGRVPNRKSAINVGSAGTAARFLTVFLAFAGGSYTLNASEQMCSRPMEPLISVLRKAGICITCLNEEGHFPFTLDSNGINISKITVDTSVSSQFASAILMAATLLKDGLTVNLTGSRTAGAYIDITLKMMEQFGYGYTRNGDTITVPGSGNLIRKNTAAEPYRNKQTSTSDHIEKPMRIYNIEPDVSAAGYFYAMSPICNKKVQVNGVHLNSMQGDIKFIRALENLGCRITEDEDGIILNPPVNRTYNGIDIDMNDFSDQTMTMAVVAAYAGSPTTIHNVGHIRCQESDRLNAIVNELNRLGCICRPVEDDTGIYIEPSPMHGADIETYEDHRIAMAFSLAGLRTPKVTILNPGCCSKTFEDYFSVLDSLCEP